MLQNIKRITCFILACAGLWAQSTAQIQGTVQDPSGSAVPGAEVKATQTETGAVRTVTSGADGGYVLPNLPIGPYRLEVSHMGFTTYVQTGIVLQVASNPTLDVAMKVGAVTEQVQVEANAALVETERTGIGTVIENQRILELPLNGRNVTDLIQLAGAAVPTNPGASSVMGGIGGIAVAGGQTYGVSYLLDGAGFNNPFDASSMPFPFPDALQEFKVETSALTAQNGQHSGAAINAVTKSGTNSYHGDAFEFLRNGALNARNFFATSPDTLKRNQFGGTFGGPIKKNKLFFFMGYQGTRTRQAPTGNIAFIPTAQMLGGDFSSFASAACNGGTPLKLGAPFSGNKVSPSLYNASALALVAKLPTTTDPCGKVNFGVVSDPNVYQVLGRVDYQINEKHSMFGRYMNSAYYLPPAVAFSNILASSTGGKDQFSTSAAFGDTYLISSTTVNSFRASFNRAASHSFISDFVSGCDVGVKMYCFLPHDSVFSITGGFAVGGATATNSFSTPTNYQLTDDISLVRGAHQIAFGIIAEQYRASTGGNVYAQGNFSFTGVATGSGMADFLLGDVGSFQQGNRLATFTRKNYIAAYVRDTWKLTPRLTVNLGVRWEPFIPLGMTNGAVYNFSPAAYAAGVRTTQFANAPPGLTYPGDPGFPGNAGLNRQWNLFAPRVGIAWDPKGDGRMTVRASYGLAYDFNNAQYYNNVTSAPPWGNLIKIPGPINFSNPWATYPGGNLFPYIVGPNSPFAPFGTFVALDPNLKQPSVNQWNLVIQKQFGNDWLVSATYAGSEAEHLWGSFQLNPAVLVPSSSPIGTCPANVTANCNSTTNINQRRILYLQNPAQGQYIGYMDQLADGGTASYNGLILSLQKRLSRGLSVSANYAWSHCIGDQSTGGSLPGGGGGYTVPNNRRVDRGNCASASVTGLESADRRQIFNLTAVGTAPRFANNTARLLASNWKLAGIYRATSGQSLTATTATDRALNGQTNERPNQVLANPLCDDPRPSCWINPSAFAVPAFGTLGNAGTNNIRGPGFFQFDLALSREFRVHEGQTLEFRGEAFNVTNSFRAGGLTGGLPNGLSGVSTTQSNTFGQILSALDPRIMQFALKFVF